MSCHKYLDTWSWPCWISEFQKMLLKYSDLYIFSYDSRSSEMTSYTTLKYDCEALCPFSQKSICMAEHWCSRKPQLMFHWSEICCGFMLLLSSNSKVVVCTVKLLWHILTNMIAILWPLWSYSNFIANTDNLDHILKAFWTKLLSHRYY